MALINATHVSVHLPIYNMHSRSLKKTLFRLGTGGRISQESKHVVIEALRDVSFRCEDGDRVGLIGRNGSGKTTLLRTLAGVYTPAGGTIETQGHVVPLLSLGVGMSEEASGYDNMIPAGLLLGMRREEILERRDEIAEFTELGDYVHLPIHTYSEGMRTRLVFAIATAIRPDILLMDEVMAAGDIGFAEKANQRFERFVDKSNIMMIATHSEDWIRRFCNKALYFEAGRLLAAGDVGEVVDAYRSNMAAAAQTA